MDADHGLAIAREHSLFADVPQSLLTGVFSRDRLCRFVEGDYLMREGAPSNECFIILDGSVRIRCADTHLLERVAQHLIGEQGILDGKPRSADAIAIGNVFALKIPSADFRRLLNHDHRFCRNLARILSEKLRESTDHRGERYAREERLFAGFRAHASEAVLSRLLNSNTFEEDWQPDYRILTILFADIRDFTRISSELPVSDLVSQLNSYFESAADIIHSHDGLIDKFIGDAIMAVFGYPDRREDDQLRAIRCALALQENNGKLYLGEERLRTGIGVAAGKVFCGNIGSGKRCQFTVIGRSVNLASRLQEATKCLDAPILISQEVYEGSYRQVEGVRFDEHCLPLEGMPIGKCYSLEVLET